MRVLSPIVRGPRSDVRQVTPATAQRGFAYVVVTLHQLTIEFLGEDGAVLFTKTLTK